MRVTVQVKSEITLDIETAAKWFSELSDDEQCRFLVAVAGEMDKWPGGADGQLYHIGGHLRNCECSTDAAREWVDRLAHYARESNHGIPIMAERPSDTETA